MCGVKRAYNPQMSRVFETRRHRGPSEILKHSSYVPVEMEDVESYLDGIMEDIDTILRKWRNHPGKGGNSIKLAIDDEEAMRTNLF